MRLRSSSGSGLFIAAALATLTLAQEGVCDDAKETARLAYTTPAEVPGCPDEASFRNLVAARLGYDPFVPEGRHDAAVAIEKHHGKLVARARVTRQGQTEPGVRELGGTPDQCEALAQALATTVAIALDPVRGRRGPETSSPALPASLPAPAPAPAPVFTPAPVIVFWPPPPPYTFKPAPVHRHTPVSFFGVARGLAAIGAAPGPTLGGELGIGLGVGAFSITGALRVEATPGTAIEASGDAIEATMFTGDVIPCGHLARWSLCGLARLGVFEGRSPSVVRPRLGGSLYFAVGARGGYALPITDALALTAGLEAAVPLLRTTLTIDQAVAWTAPPISAALDLGIKVTFF
jgi:hypothetical protein